MAVRGGKNVCKCDRTNVSINDLMYLENERLRRNLQFFAFISMHVGRADGF